MNKSEFERLRNQARKEQSVTPELKLSTELRDVCEKLLREKGKNKISTSELIIQVLQPLGAIRSLATWTKPQNLVRRTETYLEKRGENEPSIFISCIGVNPSNADIDILLIPDAFEHRNKDHWGLMWLRLEKKGQGVIMQRNGDGNRPGAFEYMKPNNLATTQDLLFYQDQINQSSPIGHK